MQRVGARGVAMAGLGHLEEGTRWGQSSGIHEHMNYYVIIMINSSNYIILGEVFVHKYARGWVYVCRDRVPYLYDARVHKCTSGCIIYTTVILLQSISLTRFGYIHACGCTSMIYTVILN